MAGLPPPPRWFIPAIGLVVAVAAVLAVVRMGGGDAAPVAASSPSQPSVSPTGATTTPTPSPTAPATTTAPPSPSPEPTEPAGVALGASCSNDREGYGIDYPAGWFTPTQPAWVCQLFDPEPFVVEPNTEPPIVAVTVYVDGHRRAKLLAALTDPALYRVISTSEGTFADAGRPGTVVETEQVEDLLWPAGTLSFSVLVDRVDTTIVVTTSDLAGSDYEANKQLVLAMARSLRIAG